MNRMPKIKGRTDSLLFEKKSNNKVSVDITAAIREMFTAICLGVGVLMNRII